MPKHSSYNVRAYCFYMLFAPILFVVSAATNTTLQSRTNPQLYFEMFSHLCDLLPSVGTVRGQYPRVVTPTRPVIINFPFIFFQARATRIYWQLNVWFLCEPNLFTQKGGDQPWRESLDSPSRPPNMAHHTCGYQSFCSTYLGWGVNNNHFHSPLGRKWGDYNPGRAISIG